MDPGQLGALDWDIVLNTAVPLPLALETGASESRLTLTDLQVRELSVSTGASSTRGPSRPGGDDPGARRERRRLGEAARPAGGGGAVTVHGALADIRVDSARFPRSGDSYRSPDYDSAANRVEILVETGVGSVEIS